MVRALALESHDRSAGGVRGGGRQAGPGARKGPPARSNGPAGLEDHGRGRPLAAQIRGERPFQAGPRALGQARPAPGRAPVRRASRKAAPQIPGPRTIPHRRRLLLRHRPRQEGPARERESPLGKIPGRFAQRLRPRLQASPAGARPSRLPVFCCRPRCVEPGCRRDPAHDRPARHLGSA